MKKLSKIIFVCLLITIILSIIFFLSKNEKVLKNKDNTKTNFISMMVEQTDGTYKENTNVNFVSEGYIFNPQKSGCENGGTLVWNKRYEKVEASLLTSDKCYAYFDIYSYEKYCSYGYEDSLAC